MTSVKKPPTENWYASRLSFVGLVLMAGFFIGMLFVGIVFKFQCPCPCVGLTEKEYRSQQACGRASEIWKENQCTAPE